MKVTAQLEEIAPDRVTLYRKTDNGWTIAKFRDADTGILFVGKGIIPFEPSDGDRYELEGEWQTSEYNGSRELIIKSAMLSIPEDKRSLLTYAVEITKGLGDAKEAAIWEQYGADWQEHPDLDDVAGVTNDTRFNWRNTLDRIGEEQDKTQAIGFLLHAGCTMLMAIKAWDEFGTLTIPTIQTDPYQLARLPRIGFLTIDGAIRRSLGIKDDNPKRFKAAAMYAMEQLAETNGTLIDRDALSYEVERLTGCGANAFEASLESLASEDQIVAVESGFVALADDYRNETNIWEYLT